MRQAPAVGAGEGGVPVWLMLSDRPGDNAQATAVVRAAGLPYAVKPVVPVGGPSGRKSPASFAPTLLDPERSAPLGPPWPDLAVAVGRWATPAALWVRERSGGRTRVVLVGRPGPGELDRLALALVPPQYGVPAHPAVVRLDLPPLALDGGRLAEAEARWRPRLRGLLRPLTAVLVGGRTKPFRLDEAVARTLAGEAVRLVAREGGSLHVVTSPRTDPAVARTLAAHLPPGTALFDWRTGAPDDNPYLGLLACADRFVVTGDSVSMMVEVASLGRPLAVFGLPKEQGPGARLGAAARAWLHRPDRAGALNRLSLLAYRLGLAGFPRDLEAVHRKLYARGLAVPLGRPFPEPGPGFRDDLAEAAARIRGLLGDAHRPDPTRAARPPARPQHT